MPTFSRVCSYVFHMRLHFWDSDYTPTTVPNGSGYTLTSNCLMLSLVSAKQNCKIGNLMLLPNPLTIKQRQADSEKIGTEVQSSVFTLLESTDQGALTLSAEASGRLSEAEECVKNRPTMTKVMVSACSR